MDEFVGPPAPPWAYDPRIDAEFLQAFLCRNAEDLWACNHDAADAAQWFLWSGKSSPTSFPRICRMFQTDPSIIRREVMRELHRRVLDRIRAREPRWQSLANWYAEREVGPFPFDWFCIASRIPKNRLQNEVLFAIRHALEDAYSEECVVLQPHTA